MTAGLWTYVLFGLTCLVLLTLPFVPAIREWLVPSDASALSVSLSYTNDIDHFARRLDADARARLGRGPSTGFENFDFLGKDLRNLADLGKATRRTITSSIRSQDSVHCSVPLYVDGSIQAGGESTFSALYATGSIALGACSEIQDWGHADGVMVLASNSVAMRRISAGTAIELGNETWFERRHPLCTSVPEEPMRICLMTVTGRSQVTPTFLNRP